MEQHLLPGQEELEEAVESHAAELRVLQEVLEVVLREVRLEDVARFDDLIWIRSTENTFRQRTLISSHAIPSQLSGGDRGTQYRQLGYNVA